MKKCGAFPMLITFDDLAHDLRLEKYRSEKPLVISADFDVRYSTLLAKKNIPQPMILYSQNGEDAHNCILDFDKNASLFAVYDGHGGHEVAEYCSKNLPDFIKKTENYTKGEFEQALKDAFLGFDATLATPEVVSLLKAIASGKDGEKPGSEAEAGSGSEDEEETVDGLMQEAHMPLEQVMARYKGAGPLCRLLKGEGKPPVSPMLRGRRSSSGSASGSGDGPSGSGAGTSRSSSEDAEVSSSSSSHAEGAAVVCNGEAVHMNGEVGEEEGDAEKKGSEAEVDSSDNKEVKEEKVLDKVEKCADEGEKKVERTEADSSGQNNGEIHSGVSSSSETEAGNDGISSSSPSKKKKRISSAEMYQKLMMEDSDSEEEDETFTADAESEDGSSDEAAEGAEEKEGEDDEESSVDDEEEEDDDDVEYPGMDVKEEPGSDSGCTAVVALLVGSDLWVANAGDSRCVVSRDGKALEMSVDHKPEDEPERVRIEAAGGKVTCDGRVNGGLNLSRAIGDHSYKQVKLLPPSQQMITALPDIQRLTLDPSRDEFMVLACDGIWNSLSSQEVVDFVRTKLEQNTEKLSQICEEHRSFVAFPANTAGEDKPSPLHSAA
ncbi:Protein phosphatase 1G [Homalodisca vitripennis]|nr:Protein phosphatase 1G [Homalodisca vitripennis]